MKTRKGVVQKLQLLGVAAAIGIGLLAVGMVTLAGVSFAASAERTAPSAAVAPASALKIGDYVWYDANVNGFYDLDDTDLGEQQYVGGINDVRVNLYKDLNTNGQIDPGEFVTSTTTGAKSGSPGSKGYYVFDAESGATYFIEVDPSNFGPGGKLKGMALTSGSTIVPNPYKVSIPPTGGNNFGVDFGFVESGVVLDKKLLTANTNPLNPGDGASFQIVVTNTGYLTMTTVPLWDYYGPACLTFVTATVAPDTVDPSLGILHWNNLGQLDPGKSVTVTVNFTANLGMEMYWKEGGWADYAPKGLPDFSQRQDAWGTGTGQPPEATWRWSGCGPVAAANSLWWFDSKFETNTLPPPTIADTYPLVTAYGTWDDHSPSNVEPLVNALAAQMGTTPLTGTNVAGLAAGINQYITSKVGPGQYSVTVQAKPTFDWVADEVRRSEDVILLLGFWQFVGGQQPLRIGGHYVTVAGANAMSPAIAFSDPYTDRAEFGGAGRVIPDPHLTLHAYLNTITDTVHNDAAIISHDVYTVTATSTPGGTWGPFGYIQNCANANAFLDQNVGDWINVPFTCVDTLPIFAEVEYAVAVSPITPTVRCSPTVNIAVASGVIDVKGNTVPAAQDETPVTIREKTTAVLMRSLKAAEPYGGVLLASMLVAAAVLVGAWWALRRRQQA